MASQISAINRRDGWKMVSPHRGFALGLSQATQRHLFVPLDFGAHVFFQPVAATFEISNLVDFFGIGKSSQFF